MEKFESDLKSKSTFLSLHPTVILACYVQSCLVSNPNASSVDEVGQNIDKLDEELVKSSKDQDQDEALKKDESEEEGDEEEGEAVS